MTPCDATSVGTADQRARRDPDIFSKLTTDDWRAIRAAATRMRRLVIRGSNLVAMRCVETSQRVFVVSAYRPRRSKTIPVTLRDKWFVLGSHLWPRVTR